VPSETRAEALFTATWYVLFPAFSGLQARLSYERGCLDPHELLQSLMRRQGTAVIVAAVYVSAYAWVTARGVSLVRAGGLTATTLSRLDWNGLRVILMVGLIAADQIPRQAWTWFYAAVSRC
jgi:hypothetical protein